METKDTSPLWLNLKKDYIDANFVQFQKYLKKCVKNNTKDFIYEATIDLFRKWVSEVVEQIASYPLYEDYDNAIVKKNVSLLSTYLLVEDNDDELSLPVYVALMSQLCILKPKYVTHIVDAAMQRLRNHTIIKIGYSWDDLDNICSDLFAYKVSTLFEFNDSLNEPRIYSNNGTAFISGRGVCLTDENLNEAIKLYHSGQDGLSTSIGVTLRTSDKKLKNISTKELQAIHVFLKSFIRNQIDNNTNKTIENDDSEKEPYMILDPRILKLLLRLMFLYQSNLVDPTERYLILSQSRIMAEMICDRVSSSYIQFAQNYLMALEKFANDEKGNISDITLCPSEEYKESKAAKIRLAVVGLLKLYGEKSEDKILSSAISEYSVENPKLTRLAILIQSSNLLQKDIDNKDDNIIYTIKKQINKVLGVQTKEEKDVDLEANAGINLGQESGRQENKTSIVFPAGNNMQADVKKQNFVVMKGVCGFLNSLVGGTLYLGVDDWGNVKGIDEDLKYLKKNGNYYKVDSPDGYKNYIMSVVINYFGKDVARFVHIYDHISNGKVYIEIVVDSYPYEIVRIKDQAYLRFNNSSREIDENTCRNILAEKTIYNNDVTRAIKMLHKARHEKKCVLLKDYASNNSKSVKDRFVEPFEIDSTNNIVWCYDRDKGRNATFKINRIRYVEVLNEKSWECEEKHDKGNLDIFNISSTPSGQQIHIKLELNLVARNLLIEEFPLAEKYISSDLKDADKWYLETDVNRIDDIARFYMGLADCITIIQAPELEHYVEKYAKEYFKWAVNA